VEAVVNSIVYASVAMRSRSSSAGAAFAVADTGGSRFLDGLILPLPGASAVMLGLGFLIAFDTSLSTSERRRGSFRSFSARRYPVRRSDHAPTLRSIDRASARRRRCSARHRGECAVRSICRSSRAD
jgi:hypothetical protein